MQLRVQLFNGRREGEAQGPGGENFLQGPPLPAAQPAPSINLACAHP